MTNRTKEVLIWMYHFHKEGISPTPSRLIAEEMGITRQAVDLHLKKLKARGLTSKVKKQISGAVHVITDEGVMYLINNN